MIRVGIIGGAGYTAGELLRILLRHPAVEIVFVHSNSHAGKPLYTAHSDLYGDTDMLFTEALSEVNVVFLCTGHGKSLEFLNEQPLLGSPHIIDLSQDFRLEPDFRTKDGQQLTFVYGLPEWNRDRIRTAQHIANPGCFATAFQLALLPLAQAGLLNGEVHVNGVTGSTGAGQSLSATSHFSWRNNNISIYKPFTHQHLKEVRKTLETVAGHAIAELNFLPVRGDFTRGIFLSAYTQTDKTQEELTDLYRNFYVDAAFTFVRNEEICLKEVVNTNKCLIHVEKIGNKALITSVLDNLLKGASGQAVQNMNLLCGIDEKTGLGLKAMAF
ncbi:MAG: N-acetyl-gamma-glutamyl-phosphate reductase [Bacteroidales bacterium]|jgi:N-acetyl-gamma-glutamyl-phosphate reductase|nr:N-acetyl-gamma-glutamyl-phosphate reductase [Bacteroidales bacterium]